MSNIYDLSTDPPVAPLEAPKRSKKRETLSASEIRAGHAALTELRDLAVRALQDAMQFADHATSIKAAQILLDRIGYGPKTTVDINTTNIDLSVLSREELAERAAKISEMLRVARTKTIDVTPTIQ